MGRVGRGSWRETNAGRTGALPDYSNTGLSVLAGVTVGIPVRLDRRGDDEHHTKTVRKVRRIEHDHDD